MDYLHNVHDCLGGYPYDFSSPAEVSTLMDRGGIDPVRMFTKPGVFRVLGSGCDEFV